MLARALRDSGDADGAIPAFKKAIALNPDRAFVGELAKLLAPRGRLEELRVIWERLLERNPPESRPLVRVRPVVSVSRSSSEAYRRASKDLLDRFGNSTDWVVAERTSLACLLLPDSGDEIRRAVRPGRPGRGRGAKCLRA